MKNKFLFLLSLSVIWEVNAQSESKNYTLRQCVDYALTNNVSIKNATIDEYIAQSKVNEYIGSGLPQVSANAGVQLSDPLRAMYLKNKPGGFIYNPNIAENAVYSIPNMFQLPNTLDASVSVTQLIFSNTFFVGLKASKTYGELAKQSKAMSQTQVVENVTKAYYMVLVNAERKKMFDANITRLDSLLKQTQALYKSGFAEKIDVSRLEVGYNNLLTEKANFDNMLVLSSILLKYQMNMPLGDELGLSENIASVSMEPALASIDKADYANRNEYKLLKTKLELNKLNHRAQRDSYLPTLAFSGNMGYFTQSDNIDFSHGFSRYGTYGLGLNVPIFSGFSRLKKVQQADLEVQKSQNDLKQFEQTIDLQLASSQISYKNSLQSLESQKKNMELAKEVVRVSQIKYKSGVGSNIEVITAESSLKESQVNYYNALYEAIVAKVDYDKALGNLK